MTFNELDLYRLIKGFTLKMAKMDLPEPGPYWQHSEWVHTMQTILELEKILDSWTTEVTHDIHHG